MGIFFVTNNASLPTPFLKVKCLGIQDSQVTWLYTDIMKDPTGTATYA